LEVADDDAPDAESDKGVGLSEVVEVVATELGAVAPDEICCDDSSGPSS